MLLYTGRQLEGVWSSTLCNALLSVESNYLLIDKSIVDYNEVLSLSALQLNDKGIIL